MDNKIKQEIQEYILSYKNSRLDIQCQWKQTTLFLDKAVELLEKINKHNN